MSTDTRVTVTVPVFPSRYWIGTKGLRADVTEHNREHYETEHVLKVTHKGRTYRHGIGYVSEHGVARLVQDGPMVPGPHAFAYGLSSVIDNYGGTGRESRDKIAAKTEHEVTQGDHVVIAGRTFVVALIRDSAEWATLIPQAEHVLTITPVNTIKAHNDPTPMTFYRVSCDQHCQLAMRQHNQPTEADAQAFAVEHAAIFAG